MAHQSHAGVVTKNGTYKVITGADLESSFFHQCVRAAAAAVQFRCEYE